MSITTFLRARPGSASADSGRANIPKAVRFAAGSLLKRLPVILDRAIVQDHAMSRIARVEAWPVNAPLEAPYLMAPGTVPGISRTIVRLTTEDGIQGLGESASVHDAKELRGELGQGFVGRDTDEVRTELEPAVIAPPEHRTDGKVLIRNPGAGVEIALWDIAAREARVPLYEFLAQDRNPLARIPVAQTSLKAPASRPHRSVIRSAPVEVPCRTQVQFTEYFAYRPGREDSPSEVAAYCARMAEEHDSPVFEGKVAVRPVEEDARLVREIRAAIGPERELRLDANMGWRLETARNALSLLEPFDVANVEEPLASFIEMAELRRSSAIPFSAHTPDVTLAAELGVPDALVLGLGRYGLAGTRRFIAECEQSGVGFWFYSGDFGIATAAYLQLAAATPYLDRPSQSLLRWTADDVILGGPFSPERGAVDVPTEPGLGVELDETALDRCVERYAREGEYDFYSGGPLPRY